MNCEHFITGRGWAEWQLHSWDWDCSFCARPEGPPTLGEKGSPGSYGGQIFSERLRAGCPHPFSFLSSFVHFSLKCPTSDPRPKLTPSPCFTWPGGQVLLP